MRSKFLPTVTILAVVGGFCVAVACKVEHGEEVAGDAGADATSEQDEDAASSDDVAPMDAYVSNCMLTTSDYGPDPVQLCVQKPILLSLHNDAFNPKTGVATSWSYVSGLPDTDGGVILHTWQDDVAYANACYLYHQNAQPYGDTSLTPTVDADLLALAPLIESELATLPLEYDGDDYRRIRGAASGLNVLNDDTDGTSVGAIADGFGRQIYSKFFYKLAAQPAADGGAADGGPTDAGQEAGPAPTIPNGIIGTPRSLEYAYVTAEVATAALALLDMATLHPTDPNQVAWQSAAESAFDHIYNRARDPKTGLYYTALVTTSDGALDAIDTTVSDAATEYADTTATVALALAHAAALVSADQLNQMEYDAGLTLPVVTNYPFSQHVTDAIAALNNSVQSLYDGPAGDAGATATGFMEGYAPGTATPLITTKTTRSNAYALGALHLLQASTGTTYDTEIAPLTATLSATMPPNSSLFTCVPNQTGFFRACTRPFGLVNEPYGTSYQTQAIVAFVEAFSEFLPNQSQGSSP
jgi:hypothetical protein